MEITAYDIAKRFTGIAEVDGVTSHPAILAMLQFYDKGVVDDETPWCAAFVGIVCYLLGLPQTRSLAARSWLKAGVGIDISAAKQGNDIVVLRRGANSPGASVLHAPGHVGFFSRRDGDNVYLLGGNQGNKVSVAAFPLSRVLGVRRLYPFGVE